MSTLLLAASRERPAGEIETKNHAEHLVYATEKTLNENREKLPAADVSAIESAISELKAAIGSNDAGRMEQAREALTRVSHKMAEAVYRQSEPQAGPASTQGSVSDNDVIDAEFRETA